LDCAVSRIFLSRYGLGNHRVVYEAVKVIHVYPGLSLCRPMPAAQIPPNRNPFHPGLIPIEPNA